MLRTLRPSLATLSLLTLLSALLVTSALARPTHVLLILDASGSMYLRLDDGQYRIEAAKDALTQFVTRLPDAPDLDVGLRVYGSRLFATEADACLDSELVIPVEGFDRERLVREIQAIQAKGATPIAYSLELGLEDLRDLPGHKVVVLVTDGAESCGGDVRAVVDVLTAEGFDVDVRIIGFALSEYAIETFQGVADFESTNSAAELAAALGRAVGVDPDASYPVTVTLTRDGEAVAEGATVRFVDAVDEDVVALVLGTDGAFSGSLAAGTYRAEIADAFSPAPLVVVGLPVTPTAENSFAFELTPAADVALVVEPSVPTAGDFVTVQFEGSPDTAGSWITVVPLEAPDTVSVDRASADGASGSVTLRIPGEAGELEARFHLALPEGGSRVIGRSPAVVSEALSAHLDAPDEVSAGTPFEVAWGGPDADGDYVTVVPVGTRDGMREGMWAGTRDGSPVTLVAPPVPGAYEVRYVLRREHRTLAHVPITVGPPDASLEVDAEVGAGGPFEVAWQGPDNEGDYVTIVPAGVSRDAAFDIMWSRVSTADGSPVTLSAPPEPGAYEVRYVLGQGRRLLVSEPVSVVAAGAVIDAPTEVAAGEAFEVGWTGPDNEGDYVTIVPAGVSRDAAFDIMWSRVSTGDGSPVTLQAPPEPGEYEVRYVLGQGRRMLESLPITVMPTTTQLVAPPEVDAGTTFEVEWTGPDNEGDYVTIVPAGVSRDAAFNIMWSRVSTRHGSPVTLKASDEPGDFEIRYVLGSGRRMLQSVPIRVR